MDWLRYAAALAVLLVITVIVGAFSRLTQTIAETSSLYTIGILVAAILLVSMIAIVSTDRISTPYW